MRFPFLHLSVPGHKRPTWKKSRPGMHGEDDFGVMPPPPGGRHLAPPTPPQPPGVLARLRNLVSTPQTWPPAGYTAPGTPSPIQHLIPPVATLKAMTPPQLTALYARLPPGSQIAGFPPPNAFYFPNPDGTNPAPGWWSSQHQPHGEDAGDSSSPGATDSNSPNYGSGSFAVDTDPMVGDVEMMVGQVHGIGTPGSFAATLAGGGIGAGSMSVLPGQHGMPYDGYLSPGQVPDDTTDDPHSAYQPFADDPYSPPLREPNRRNYKAEFGDEVGFEHELYSGFGISAVIGGEEDLIVAGDIGCAMDTALKS